MPLLGLFLLASASVAEERYSIGVQNEKFEVRFSYENVAPQQRSVANSESDGINYGERVEIIDPRLPVLFIGGQWIPDSGSAVDIGTNVTVERTVDGDDQVVRFRTTDHEAGLVATWAYHFPQSGFFADLTVTITASHTISAPLGGSLYLSFGPGLGHFDQDSFTRGLVKRSAGVIENLEPPDADIERDPATTDTGGREPISWAALHSRYYLFAIIGDSNVPLDEDVQLSIEKELQYSGLLEPDRLPGMTQILLRSPHMSIEPGASVTRSFRFFLGPKDRQLLSRTGIGLEKSIFAHLPNWFAQICNGVYYVLAALQSLLRSWGVSIIVIAVAMRICVFPLSLYGMRAQARFRRKQEQLNPLIAEVKSIHKGNARKISEETARLYKKVGMQPLDALKGSLPLLIQLPILIAFYQILSASYELHGEPFLWISDLTRPDGLFSFGFSVPLLGSTVNLLPILMFLAHIIVARDVDSSQHAGEVGHRHSLTIYLFPLLMFLLFYAFPAGCMLYWTTGSILQVFEQRWCRAYISNQEGLDSG